MPVKINGTTSGSVTLAAPDTGSDVTLTLPTTALATQAYADSAADAAEAAAIAGGGLVLISPTSIANSGGSASSSNGTTTFSAVSSISLNGLFTSTYRNYRIVVDVTAVSTASQTRLRYRASGTDTTTNYRWTRVEASTTPNGPGNESSNADVFIDLTFAQTAAAIVSDIFGPQAANRTLSTYQCGRFDSVLYTVGGAGIQTDTTQFDGLTIYRASGDMTGTIRVYGYKGA